MKNSQFELTFMTTFSGFVSVFCYKSEVFMQFSSLEVRFRVKMFKFLVFLASFAVVKSFYVANIDELSIFAKANQFPQIVAVLGDNGNSFKCSGTIVDKFTVLCAANCVDNRNRSSRDIVSILAGTNSLISGGVRRNVFIALIEKDEKFLKNIAMLRLQKPLEFSDSIKPAELAKYFKMKAIGNEKCGQAKNASALCLGDLEGKNEEVVAETVCQVSHGRSVGMSVSIFEQVFRISSRATSEPVLSTATNSSGSPSPNSRQPASAQSSSVHQQTP
jgi:hypothetical protein